MKTEEEIKKIEDEFKELIDMMSDDQYWKYIKSWKDTSDLYEQMIEWDVEVKEEAIEDIKKLMAEKEIIELIDEFIGKCKYTNSLCVTTEILNRVQGTNYDKQKIIEIICQARISVLEELKKRIEDR